MSGRKPGPSKITLGMLKGKSIATSVPSFAIRFHSGDEELEEIYPSADETDDEAEKTEDDASSAKDISGVSSPGDVVPPMTLTTTTSTVTLTGSASASATTAPSRDPSPMKEYLKGLGKRSTSMDAGIIDIGTFGSSSGDTWRIFHELKGKITKTVEEKFSEIKSDRKSSSSLLSSSAELGRGGRLGAGGKSKDNSSISDSEDVSEPSAKSVPECKIGAARVNDSPRKFIGKDHVKSSSFEEREDNFFSDSFTDPPSTSSAVEASDVVDISSEGFIKKSNFRSKMRHLSNLRHRHKSGYKIPLGSTVTMSSLSASAGEDDGSELGDSDVEPAIEVSEDTRFSSEQPDTLVIEPDIPTVDYRTGIPTSHPSQPLRRHCLGQTRGIFATLWSYRFILLILIMLFMCLLFSVPSYIMGFICGAGFVIIYTYIRNFFKQLLAPVAKSPIGERREQEAAESFSPEVPGKSSMAIQKIPAIKEYEPLTKYAGWMNEYLGEYVPETYSINDAQSVYIRLQGSVLRISHTRLKIPKRAMWNERKHKLKFTHQRIYNISDCDIKLLPEGLARKRLWSKKYPICIELKSFSKFGIQYLKGRSDVEDGNEHPDVGSIDSGAATPSIEDDNVDITDAGSSDTFDHVDGELFHDVIKTGTKESADEDELSAQDLTDDEDTFCHIDKTAFEATCLYLFARTDREKEDWYRRFIAAAKYADSQEDPLDFVASGADREPKSPGLVSEPTLQTTEHHVHHHHNNHHHHHQQQQQQPEESSETPQDKHITPRELEENNLEYLKFMSRFHLQVLTGKGLRVLSEPYCNRMKIPSPNSREKKFEAQMQNIVEKEIDSDVMWLNAIVGRILFDILRNPFWVKKIQERIQKKLSAIKLPYFMEDLLVTELDIGNTVPIVHKASVPMLDQCGLWVDLDVSYEGAICLTLETKLNLMKLKKIGEETAAAHSSTAKEHLSPSEKRGSPMFDSDIDDSAESSDDATDLNKSTSEEDEATGSGTGGGTGKKILRMVNKIAASKYFQHVTEYKYIKRAMEEVSNTKIMLTVELNGVVGTLALNIPPHPSDRLWYGFRGNPRLWLSARPKFGERRVNIGHVVSWIEKKLIQEFQVSFILADILPVELESDSVVVCFQYWFLRAFGLAVAGLMLFMKLFCDLKLCFTTLLGGHAEDGD
ncbi:testis-expressed protein 2 [Anabrus simplex]|uniref:testis-expressed protein 2 n=1 Tax=Anabrus simplex TaxID=316456 RepID=UPI0035A344EB